MIFLKTAEKLLNAQHHCGLVGQTDARFDDEVVVLRTIVEGIRID